MTSKPLNNATNQPSRAAPSSSSSPLRINKDSRAIRKVPSNSLEDHCTTNSKGPSRQNPNPNIHEPIIIYTQDPEVFHAEPSTFKSVVQTLTGLRQPDDGDHRNSNRAKSEVADEITSNDHGEGKGTFSMKERRKENDCIGGGGLNMRVVNEQAGNNFLGFFEDENLPSSSFVDNQHTSDDLAMLSHDRVPPSDIESYLNVFNSPLGDDFTDFMDTLPDLEPFLFN